MIRKLLGVFDEATGKKKKVKGIRLTVCGVGFNDSEKKALESYISGSAGRLKTGEKITRHSFMKAVVLNAIDYKNGK